MSQMILSTWIVLSFVLILNANRAFGNAKGNSEIQYHNFPVPQQVAYQTQFWTLIFSRYSSSDAVIHDIFYPNIIVDVIDFDVFAQRYHDGQPYNFRQKKQLAERYLQRYSLAIQRIKSEGRRAQRYGSMEKRVLAVYGNHPEGMKHLLKGQAELRYQTGLADEFGHAALRAQKYLPYMERIFRQYGIPVDLTRIAFVESMFNEKALSKVGASGIWQFMPDTARRFMMVNHVIDERNSPIKASTAAAQLLSHNYKRLKSWPLAITAYNHGAGGMQRAVRITGTRDLGEIIKRYRHPSFGFASRNFYSEFLAARTVYRIKHDHRFREYNNPLGISYIKLEKPVSVHQLLSYTPLDEGTLKRYNACLKSPLFEQQRYRLLPRDYELIVPRTLAPKVRQALRTIVISENRHRGFRS